MLVVSILACSQRRREPLTRWVPRTEDDPPICGVVSNLVDALSQLVDALARVVSVAINVSRPEMAPLEPIHGSKVALAAVRESTGVEKCPRGVAIPDLNAALREEFGVCFTADEPEEFFDDTADVGTFSGEEGESGVCEGEAEGGGCEESVCAGAGAVVAGFAVCDDTLDEGEVLVFFVGGHRGWKERRSRHDALILSTRVSRMARDQCHVTPGNEEEQRFEARECFCQSDVPPSFDLSSCFATGYV